MGLFGLPVLLRSRVGSHLECHYRLQPFGIPSGAVFKMDEPGDFFPAQYHRKWLLSSKQDEEANAIDPPKSNSETEKAPSITAEVAPTGDNDTTFVTVAPNDILFGRGASVENHEGNLRFKELVEQYGSSYDASGRSDKPIVAGMVTQRLKDNGARFLKRRPGGGWAIVSDVQAQQKVAKAFRNQRTKVARQKQQRLLQQFDLDPSLFEYLR